MPGRGRRQKNFAGSQPSHGGSASGYSYFNRHPAHDSNDMDQGWGDERWNYHGYQRQSWSSSAGGDDYDESYGAGHSQMGWQEYGGGMDFSNGSRAHAGLFAQQGYKFAERKRPREDRLSLLGRAPKSRQQERNFYGGYARNTMRDDYDAWGGGYDAPSREWMQIPSNSGWSGGAGDYYDEEEYFHDYDYGGYADGRGQGRKRKRTRSRRGNWPSKKDMDEHAEKWKNKQESPQDKIIYSKHRILTQMGDKRNFLQAIRSVMTAMKCASETLSVEAKAESQVAELKAQEETESKTMLQEDKTKPEDKAETNSEEKEEIKPDHKAETASDENAETTAEEKAKTAPVETVKTEKPSVVKSPQVLIGVIRVGPAKRKLLVKDVTHHGEEIVAVFKDKPQKQMLHRLASLLEFNLKGPISDKAVISPCEETEMITVNLEKLDCKYPILISLTSPVYSDPELETNSDQNPNDSELLSEDKCRLALCKIRRTRWAQKVKEALHLPIVRIFMDFAIRLPGWCHLSSYAAEVLVNATTEKLAQNVRESELNICRVFVQSIEVLAAGLALPDGPGLKDPCEPGSVDVFVNLKPQEAEDLTKAAQLALRMYSCDQLSKLLDVQEKKAT